MTPPTPDPTALKLDHRAATLKKARARHRKKQRLEQAKRQQKTTQTIEAVAAHKLNDTSAQALGYILAILVNSKINPTHAIGALLDACEKLAGPDGSRLRQHYATVAKDYLASNQPQIAVKPVRADNVDRD